MDRSGESMKTIGVIGLGDMGEEPAVIRI